MEDLTIERCICAICQEIMTYPVTMPCNHEMCLECFQKNVEESSLCCPFCRKRISVWTRHSKKSGSLINSKLWLAIQEKFDSRVKKRLQGMASVDDIPADEVHRKLAEPGEVNAEYKNELEKLRVAAENPDEIEASKKLIEILINTDEKLKTQERMDEELAQKLDETMNSSKKVKKKKVMDDFIATSPRPVPVKKSSPGKCYAKPSGSGWGSKTVISTTEESTASSIIDENSRPRASKASVAEFSEDSIAPELYHFRPIRVSQKTPARLLPNGEREEVPLISISPNNRLGMATPVLLKKAGFDPEIPKTSPIVRKKLEMLDAEKNAKVQVNSVGTDCQTLKNKRILSSKTKIIEKSKCESPPLTQDLMSLQTEEKSSHEKVSEWLQTTQSTSSKSTDAATTKVAAPSPRNKYRKRKSPSPVLTTDIVGKGQIESPTLSDSSLARPVPARSVHPEKKRKASIQTKLSFTSVSSKCKDFEENLLTRENFESMEMYNVYLQEQKDLHLAKQLQKKFDAEQSMGRGRSSATVYSLRAKKD